MAATTGAAQQNAIEKAFGSKDYKFADDVLLARAQQLAQQLHMSAEALANQYDSFALVSDWSMEVTVQRLKAVAEYLEAEQRKENARPRVGAVGAAAKIVPPSMRPTWEDLPDKVDYPTPNAKRQALDQATTNPSTASKPGLLGTPHPSPGTGGLRAGAVTPHVAGTPQPRGGGHRAGWASTPGGAGGDAATPGGREAPPTAFALRTNRGQVVSVLNEHLPGPTTYCLQQHHAAGGVLVRPLSQPQLDAAHHMFLMEVLDTKVHALDERIMDFAEALTAAATEYNPSTTTTTAPGGSLTPLPEHHSLATTPLAAAAPNGTHRAANAAPPAAALTLNDAAAASNPRDTPMGHSAAAATPLPPGAAAAAGGVAGEDGAATAPPYPLSTSVVDVCPLPVWVAGRVLAETEGAPLNAESLLLEGCREASEGARVRLDVSCVRSFRLFPGQAVCVYGINPTGEKFIAHRLVTHVPPPPLALAAPGSTAGGAAVDAARASGLSMVVAAGPYCLTENLSYSPLDELLSYCTANPPDLLLLLGPFVDADQPQLTAGTCPRTADSLLREEVIRRLGAWRSAHPAACVVVMPAVRDMTALPVLPQPPVAGAVMAAVGPPDKAMSLQNPCSLMAGPLVIAGGSSDLLKALSAVEISRAPVGERLPALASHVLGQRSLYPLYPPPPGTCLDTSHYSQLHLPHTPDLLLMPSDLAPFAKLLTPATWAAGGPPGLGESGVGGDVEPVVVLNPGRLSRGVAGGTFAHVAVAPGSGPVVGRVRVEVKRV